MTKNRTARVSRATSISGFAAKNTKKTHVILTGLAVFVGIAGISMASGIGFSSANAEGAYPTLAAAFNNVGTSDNTNTRLGNFDGNGASYSRQDLAAKGWTPGATINYAGTKLKWPSSLAGQPDNVIAAGQAVSLEGQTDQGTALTFFAASNGGATSGNVTVTYTDESFSEHAITTPDWNSGSVAQNIIKLDKRNIATSTTQQTAAAQIFPVNIPLDASKTVAFVTLPSPTTGKMHIFSMAVKPYSTEWSASWGASTERVATNITLRNQTLRQIVHTSIGGSQMRVRLENTFNPNKVTLDHVTVAVQLNGKTPVKTPVNLTFNGGSRSVTMAAGSEAVSDPLSFNVPPQSRLMISYYIPGTVTTLPVHTYANETNYSTAAGAGDRTADAGTAFPTSTTYNFSNFVAGVDVSSSVGTVVTIGDSISDSVGAPQDGNGRWPDYLAYRLTGRKGVVNAGIGGNRVIADQLSANTGGGYGAMNRIYRDVIGVPGVTTMVLLEGTNDIFTGVAAAPIQAGLKKLVDQAHAYGIKVYIGTLIPFGGNNAQGVPVPQFMEDNRVAVNTWIRSGASGADGIIEFDQAVTDGGRPIAKLQTMYDSGDHAHPNAAGYIMLANAVDPSVL